MTEPTHRIMSLGGGVQSTAMILMVEEGVLPKVDVAVFADTGWEPPAVYENIEWLKGKCKTPIEIVKWSNIREDVMVAQVSGKKTDGKRFASMPLHALNPDGTPGIVRRQCTEEYKIKPIERFIRREFLGLKKHGRVPKGTSVEHWFGISFDERIRQRTCKDKWRYFHYPLVDRKITRSGCLSWVEEHGYEEPPRSACIGCPFHSNMEWRDMKINRPEEFEDACEVDDAIRNMEGMRAQTFLHRSLVPLRDVDLRNDFDKGQGSLFDDECTGMCGM